MTADDPELGRVRWCKVCQEWWPDDAEFFRKRVVRAGTPFCSRGRTYIRKVDTNAVMCRACHDESMRMRYLRAHPFIVGRVVETPDGTFLEPLERVQ